MKLKTHEIFAYAGVAAIMIGIFMAFPFTGALIINGFILVMTATFPKM